MFWGSVIRKEHSNLSGPEEALVGMTKPSDSRNRHELGPWAITNEDRETGAIVGYMNGASLGVGVLENCSVQVQQVRDRKKENLPEVHGRIVITSAK